MNIIRDALLTVQQQQRAVYNVEIHSLDVHQKHLDYSNSTGTITRSRCSVYRANTLITEDRKEALFKI